MSLFSIHQKRLYLLKYLPRQYADLLWSIPSFTVNKTPGHLPPRTG
ncbi:hypothetical protein P243_0733 [Klebsiella pneumoniae subsp. pneumoniae 1158]|nr:hypothetical protein P243_0733 [Klebsiella pneumoniae subsp. pneumoniae 1158]